MSLSVRSFLARDVRIGAENEDVAGLSLRRSTNRSGRELNASTTLGFFVASWA